MKRDRNGDLVLCGPEELALRRITEHLEACQREADAKLAQQFAREAVALLAQLVGGWGPVPQHVQALAAFMDARRGKA